MVILKLALRNLIGAGTRTWLNVFVLSIAFILILWMQGVYEGMSRDAITSSKKMELGGGQFWHQLYDPFDPMTLEDAHAKVFPDLQKLIEAKKATPILMTSGAIFPQGRIQGALLKGIDPDQQIIGVPSSVLKGEFNDYIPALIGRRMAKQSHLKKGDIVTARWRDINGVFDATDLKIIGIMRTIVPSVDSGQVWIPIQKLREMLQAPGEATLIVLEQEIASIPDTESPWILRDLDYLLKDINYLVKTKKVGGAFFYLILLSMALLAIFDTQVLAIFRRRKEIGTMMALGMPRTQIIALFTLEGALHGVLAMVGAAIYGTPLLYYSAAVGMGMPGTYDDFGIALAERLHSSYTINLVVGSTLLVLLSVTIVSFLPTRKIAKLKPTDALRGKMS